MANVKLMEQVEAVLAMFCGAGSMRQKSGLRGITVRCRISFGSCSIMRIRGRLIVRWLICTKKYFLDETQSRIYQFSVSGERHVLKKESGIWEEYHGELPETALGVFRKYA